MIVEIKNLVKRYDNVLAVDNVNLSIEEGEIFGLLGPNGAGKTTTINAILGIAKKDEGEIKIFNKDTNKFEMEIKKDIGVVPQDIAVYSDLTAIENVTFFGKLYGLRGEALNKAVKEALEFTGLWDRRNDLSRKYSGGMKRRLNIACAIVHKPKLIIMDEPTVGIDPQSRNNIIETVKKLNKNGSTIIYTSHYMEEIEELCTDITIMDHGRIIARGSNDVLKNLIAVEDTVKFEISSPSYSLIDEIKKISNVKECILENNILKVISLKNSKNLNKIIECILNLDINIISIDIDKPTLEGVFLTLTGRSLRDKEA